MGMFTSINIASSGLSAQRLRESVISNNIANVNSTRTTQGGAYRRSRVVFAPITDGPEWKSRIVPKMLDPGTGKGVKVVAIEKDYDNPLRLKYDPTHPDAILSGSKKGYVEMPNVNIVEEFTDLVSASRAYQANVEVINSSVSMFEMALNIGVV